MNKRNTYLLKRYGITEKQYEELYDRQSGCCALCGRHQSTLKKRLAVEHDHLTFEIRSLCCMYCNKYIIGRHRRDTIEVLYRYLTGTYTGWFVPAKKRKKRRGRRCRKKLSGRCPRKAKKE